MDPSGRVGELVRLLDQRGYRTHLTGNNRLAVCVVTNQAIGRTVVGTDDHGDQYAALVHAARQLRIDLPLPESTTSVQRDPLSLGFVQQ